MYTVKLKGFSKGFKKVYFFKQGLAPATCEKPFILKLGFLKGFLPCRVVY